MKEQDIIIQVLKKYDLTLPLTWLEKRRIGRSKRRTLAAILSRDEGGRLRFSVSIALYNMMRGLGLDVSPAAGGRAAFAAAMFSVLVITSGTFLIVQNSTGMFGLNKGMQVAVEAGTVVSGEGSVKSGGVENGIRAGGVVRTGDEISVAGSSTIVVRLSSGAVISALHDSTLSVAKEGTGNILDLKEGIIISKVPAPFSGVYEVRTADSSVRVTGTVFAVSYKGGKTSVMVTEGKVSITDKASGAVYELEPGGGVEISPSMKRRELAEKEISLMRKFSSIAAAGDVSDSSALKELNTLYDSIAAAKALTIDDIRAKYGQIDEVVLYSGKRYTGAVISRGAVMRIMTVNGVVNVPSNEVRNIVLK